MTFLGKLFVMANVGISLLMAFLAFGLYANAIEWGYDAAKPGQAQPGGILKQKQDEIAEVQKMQAPSEAAWKAARAELWKVEEERAKARAFYVGEIVHNRDKAGPDSPARSIETLSSLVVRDKNNPHLPKMNPAKVRGDKDAMPAPPDLYSRAYYDAEYEKYHRANLDLLAQLKTEFEEDKRLSKLIFDKETGFGLRTDLVQERDKRQGIEGERRLMRPLYVNTAVESELSNKRLAAMQAHIAELKAYCKKRGIDVELAKR